MGSTVIYAHMQAAGLVNDHTTDCFRHPINGHAPPTSGMVPSPGPNSPSMVNIKRVYDDPSPDDGTRILIDRLWPRGLSKENAKIELWLKDLAPSTALRQWFQHDPGRWKEFQKRYAGELSQCHEALQKLQACMKQGPVTFLYAAQNQEYNNAVALKAYMPRHFK